MRREQDSLNPHTHASVMILSQEREPDAHPYWYTCIISIYNTLVQHESSPDPIPIESLLVCWYGLDLDCTSPFGWKMCQILKVGFVLDDPNDKSPAFGFLDFAQVIQHPPYPQLHGRPYRWPSWTIICTSRTWRRFWQVLLLCEHVSLFLIFAYSTYQLICKICWLQYVHAISRWWHQPYQHQGSHK